MKWWKHRNCTICVLQILHISLSIGDCIERARERECVCVSWQFIWPLHLKYELRYDFCVHFILVTSSDNFGGEGKSYSLSAYLIWKFWLISNLGYFIWQDIGGYIWPSWALYLKTWPAKMSFNNNITYYTWQIWVLIIEISVAMSVAMWNCHSWPLDVSSNVKLPFLTTRCK